MVWNILFFVLGMFGGVTLMALMQVYDMVNEDEEYEETDFIPYEDFINEDVDKHIPRID